jgi:hypothetical protein
MTEKILPTSIGLATFALALGYVMGGFWALTVMIVSLGLLWWLGQARNWDWIAPWGLILFVVMAAVGLWLGLAAGWMLLGTVAALAAWDLNHFALRLKSVAWDETLAKRRRALERRHLRRLLIVNGLGLLLSAVALGIKVKFSFGAAFLLGLIAILGLSRAIGFMARELDFSKKES